MVIATELARDFALSNTTFQNMVGGEDVTANKKGKTATDVRWNAPMTFAGNR